MSEQAKRLASLKGRLKSEQVDAIYISAPVNIRYLTGFSGSAGNLLITADGATLFTDGRYRLQAAQEASGVAVAISETDPLADFIERAAELRFGRLAFEADRLSYSRWARLAKDLQSVTLVPAQGWIEHARMVKSEAEIAAIRASVELNSACFDSVLGRVTPEWTELELAAELELEMRRRGATGPAFDTIVAGGAWGARPHAASRPEPLGRGRLIVVDHGAILGGYVSDQTRLIAFGDPGSEARRLAQAAEAAQVQALEAVSAGVAAKTVDRAARNFLKQQGLDELLVHSTGHGLGLEIHEPPKLGQMESMRLRTGMVVTIEPGVYRDGLGGARVEDVVVVRPRGFERLTPPTPALTIL